MAPNYVMVGKDLEGSGLDLFTGMFLYYHGGTVLILHRA
jgi:hypothetical protein